MGQGVKIRTWSGSYIGIDRAHLALAGWVRFLIHRIDYCLGEFAALLAFVLPNLIAIFTLDDLVLPIGIGLVGWTAWQVLLTWADS